MSRLPPKPPLAARRTVVVTGVGLVTPLGTTAPSTWSNLIAAMCGIRPLPAHLVHPQVSCVVGGCVVDDPSFTPTSREARYTRFALTAVKEALADAKLSSFPDQDRVGVNIGVGIPSLLDVSDAAKHLAGSNYKLISPFFVPKILGNMVSGQVAILYGLRGGSHCTVSACATGTHCIGEGYRAIERGDVDVMIVGATESCVNPIALAGFNRMRALGSASRPFDASRDGFVMGEGAGVMVLESLEHAQRRGVDKDNIYAEVRGFGSSSDGHHITSPHPEGKGTLLSMRRALADAGLDDMSSVGWVCAHATGTPAGDELELAAVTRLVKSPVAVGSLKGAMGHLMGAAGAVETVLAVMALRSMIIPPTVGLTTPIPHDAALISLPVTQQPFPPDALTVLKNSFGFGGTNASLVLARV